jgi:tryptophan-rich sensory protein
MNEYTQYAELIKPAWAPPAFLFGPVWTFLYAVIIVSFGYVFYLAWKNVIPRKVALPFVLNIIFNAVFTPLQFGLNNNFLASIDILLVLATLIWLMKAVWPYRRWVALVNIPYLAWVSFATVLQITITYLNW